ncbi:hypothetical protein BXZ70DRAFT_81411 [Cristinia sonorae]|uniref:Uncharacterized protein n=1 Tax=Cristinia sonorae TaxID=1940300 RepID=A0A8K0URK5_9AGAR|nr:hypothetical protein BXZ70DRAFT_81411 [Cristinia sonorae]
MASAYRACPHMPGCSPRYTGSQDFKDRLSCLPEEIVMAITSVVVPIHCRSHTVLIFNANHTRKLGYFHSPGFGTTRTIRLGVYLGRTSSVVCCVGAVVLGKCVAFHSRGMAIGLVAKNTTQRSEKWSTNVRQLQLRLHSLNCDIFSSGNHIQGPSASREPGWVATLYTGQDNSHRNSAILFHAGHIVVHRSHGKNAVSFSSLSFRVVANVK